MAQRSVSRRDRRAADDILRDVMIRHLPHGKRDRIAADFDRQNHLAVLDEIGFETFANRAA